MNLYLMKTNYSLLSACLAILPFQGYAQKQAKGTKPNILFICVDDLRRELGVYGSLVKTPNMDKLASQGSVFFQHYVQVPTSGASRASMLTGHLPKAASDLSNEACRMRLSDKPEGEIPETMFHHLRRNGYYTVGIGKVSHYADGCLYGYEEPKTNKLELPYSWDEMLFDAGKWGNGWNAFFGYADGSNRQSRDKQVKPYECADVADEGYPDGLTANLAVKKLKELAAKEEPFCLAVGFFKPHLPFTAPKKYWDLYDESMLPISPMPDVPEDCDPVALHESAEFKSYQAGDEMPSVAHRLSDNYARKLCHAYFACISYVDAQVGKVLNALEESGEADNTIIVLWGDHGWHLGDLRIWGKHTLFEPSLSSTLIVKAPDCKPGIKNRRIVNSVDIYPTLMELCHIPLPQGLDGHSFANLLNHPDDSAWTDVAYSYWRHSISLRTPEYRLTYYDKKGKAVTELYQYTEDRIERKNVAEEHPEVVQKLLPLLEKGVTFPL